MVVRLVPTIYGEWRGGIGVEIFGRAFVQFIPEVVDHETPRRERFTVPKKLQWAKMALCQ